MCFEPGVVVCLPICLCVYVCSSFKNARNDNNEQEQEVYLPVWESLFCCIVNDFQLFSALALARFFNLSSHWQTWTSCCKLPHRHQQRALQSGPLLRSHGLRNSAFDGVRACVTACARMRLCVTATTHHERCPSGQDFSLKSSSRSCSCQRDTWCFLSLATKRRNRGRA